MGSSSTPDSERPGSVRRTAPLGAATLVGLVIVLGFGPAPDYALLVRASLGLAIVWGLTLVTPWTRLPRWTDVVPPLLLLALLSIIRLQLAPGLAVMALAPLFLVPIFWVALYGTRVDLLIVLGALVAARVAPTVIRRDTSDVAQGLASILVAGTVCILVNRVVVRLRAAQGTLQSLVDHLPLGFATISDGKVTYANDRLAKTLGWPSASEMIGVDVTAVLHPDEVQGVKERIEQLLRGAATPPTDRRLFHREGGEVIAELQAVRMYVHDRPVIGVTIRDVTDERHLAAAEELARARLAHERERLVAIMSAINDGVAILDSDRCGLYANPAYLALFGLAERTFAGMTRKAFCRHAAALTDDPDAFMARVEALDPDAAEEGTFTFARPRRRIMRRTLRPIALPDGPGYLVVWHDVTAEQDLISEREHLAMTDALTGLPNRRAAEEALEREVARARRSGAPLTLMLVDVDHFKQVNDRFGHDGGDRVLVALAKLLAGEARGSDTVARWGGEEFLIILPGDAAGARAYYDRVRAALAARPSAEITSITVSAGLATVEQDEAGKAALERADRRLYEAKQSGRDRAVG